MDRLENKGLEDPRDRKVNVVYPAPQDQWDRRVTAVKTDQQVRLVVKERPDLLDPAGSKAIRAKRATRVRRVLMDLRALEVHVAKLVNPEPTALRGPQAKTLRMVLRAPAAVRVPPVSAVNQVFKVSKVPLVLRAQKARLDQWAIRVKSVLLVFLVSLVTRVRLVLEDIRAIVDVRVCAVPLESTVPLGLAAPRVWSDHRVSSVSWEGQSERLVFPVSLVSLDRMVLMANQACRV